MSVRFGRWKRTGVWDKVLAALQDDTGLHELLVDATIVRAHQHAAGARKKTARGRLAAAGAAFRVSAT